MRAKAAAVVLALGLALLVAPGGASAKPGFVRFPGSQTSLMILHGSNGYFLVIEVSRNHAFLLAQRVEEERNTVVIYSRRVPSGADGRLHFGLGGAGEVDVHLVVEKVEEEKVGTDGCTGGPTITEGGHFVGTISFHPPGGFTELSVHRTPGSVIHRPPSVCRDRLRRGRAAAEKSAEGIRRLIAGDPAGERRFEVFAFPASPEEEPSLAFSTASVTRDAGPVTITDETSAPSAPDSATFAVPDLDALPATVTVEPAAPFSGSATFELPSRRSATISGDLAVELPEVGKVPLTGPKIAAGICRGLSCTRSLPKALRPHRSSDFVVVTGTTSGSSESSPNK